ncbi:hypothetical protein CAP47_03480 [Psychroflexus sp. S27]|nr:hypothetical protein CAP47_03480 [Psychroflexus sp. S27]
MIMKKFSIASVFLIFVLASCQSEKKEDKSSKPKELTAQTIVDKAIEFNGTDAYKNSKIIFDFRDFHLESEATCNGFKFSREKNDTLDVLHNSDFKRSVSGNDIKVADSTAFKLSESINSVFYFMQLPMRLNDGAVMKELKESQTFRDQSYHVVEVKFKKEGGGVDHEDVYMYWFNKDDFAMDYFAYSFKMNNGGVRFRAAKNPQKIDGVRFVDYDNYRPESIDVDLETLLKDYHNDKLIKLSEIINKNMSVEKLNLDCQ